MKKKKKETPVEIFEVKDRVKFLDGSRGIITKIENKIATVDFGLGKLYRINLNSLKKG